jgi:hypothetical protein
MAPHASDADDESALQVLFHHLSFSLGASRLVLLESSHATHSDSGPSD